MQHTLVFVFPPFSFCRGALSGFHHFQDPPYFYLRTVFWGVNTPYKYGILVTAANMIFIWRGGIILFLEGPEHSWLVMF